MTEEEWETCNDPKPLLNTLCDKSSVRKIRLFACACCRLVWDDNWPKRSRDVVAVAELFADGHATEKELNNSRSLACQTAQNAAVRGVRQRLEHSDAWVLQSRLTFAADTTLSNHHIAYSMAFSLPARLVREDERLHEVIPAVLRDIFGNPFRPVAFDPTWRTDTAVSLSRQMYDARDFSAMPILADALQDAGCDNEDVLSHCRGPGLHVRGCWVVDLISGKE